MQSARFVIAALLVAGHAAESSAQNRKHAENELLARPAVRVTVGTADADIVGQDNRTLQAAVDYVASLGGGIVEIGRGEYLMRDSLHLRSRVTVRGAGPTTVLRKDAAVRSPLSADGDFGEEAITLADPAGFEIGRGVWIASKSTNGFHTTCATILNRKDNYFTLSRPLNDDCMVANGAFAATVYPVISAYHCEDFRIENLVIDGNRDKNEPRIDGCRGAGIFFYRGDGGIVENCTVRNYNGDGISFQQSNDVQILNCQSERNAGGGLHPGSGSQQPMIRRCRLLSNDGDGFFFCWRVRGAVVEDNEMRDNRGVGISIGHKDSDNLVRRNIVTGNGRGGVCWRQETEPMAGHRIQFVENTVEDNGGYGLFIDGQTNGTVVRNNTIRDTGGGKQAVGIRIGKAVGEVTLEGNVIRATQEVKDERPQR